MQPAAPARRDRLQHFFHVTTVDRRCGVRDGGELRREKEHEVGAIQLEHRLFRVKDAELAMMSGKETGRSPRVAVTLPSRTARSGVRHETSRRNSTTGLRGFQSGSKVMLLDISASSIRLPNESWCSGNSVL